MRVSQIVVRPLGLCWFLSTQHHLRTDKFHAYPKAKAGYILRAAYTTQFRYEKCVFDKLARSV